MRPPTPLVLMLLLPSLSLAYNATNNTPVPPPPSSNATNNTPVPPPPSSNATNTTPGPPPPSPSSLYLGQLYSDSQCTTTVAVNVTQQSKGKVNAGVVSQWQMIAPVTSANQSFCLLDNTIASASPPIPSPSFTITCDSVQGGYVMTTYFGRSCDGAVLSASPMDYDVATAMFSGGCFEGPAAKLGWVPAGTYEKFNASVFGTSNLQACPRPTPAFPPSPATPTSGYCDPGDACWPSSQVWQQLNTQLGSGILHKIADVSTVYQQCVAGIRGSSPGDLSTCNQSQGCNSVGGANLYSVANGTCIFAGPCVYEDCDVTAGKPNVPVYSVQARTAAHVQTAVNFARQYRIRLSVKSTGASYSVADQQPNSILILMSDYQRYSTEGVIMNYTSCGTEHGPALKVGGGEKFGQVFGALAPSGYMLSSGAAVTVGAAGGWLQGGGLGPFDRSLGLGVDNVLQYEVVVADGSIKTANACQEPDLFWALRGGGGGNFGVVISQVSKVHPQEPIVRANILWRGNPSTLQLLAGTPVGQSKNISFAGTAGFQGTLTFTRNEIDGNSASPTISLWHNAMTTAANPITMDERLDGYMGFRCLWQGFACFDVYFRGNTSEFEKAFLAPLRTALNITEYSDVDNTGIGEAFAYFYTQYDSYYAYASGDCANPTAGSAASFICTELGYPSANGYNADAQVDQGGYESRFSWAIPSSIFMNENPTLTQQFFSDPVFTGVSGHVIGGAVNQPAADATAVHPSMRSSGLEMLLQPAMAGYFGGNTTDESMLAFRQGIEKYVPPPQGTPIFNHDARNLAVLTPLGAPYGLDWQQLYWGSNLPRLQSIKATYDPDAVFTCRDCLTTSAPPSPTPPSPTPATCCASVAKCTPTPPTPTPTPPTPTPPTPTPPTPPPPTPTPPTPPPPPPATVNQSNATNDTVNQSTAQNVTSATNSTTAANQSNAANGTANQSTASGGRRVQAPPPGRRFPTPARNLLQSTASCSTDSASCVCSPPTPSPTPSTAPVVSVTVAISQTVTFSISVSQYTGATKEAYDNGYASFLGIYESSTNSLTTGCSLTGTATAARRKSAVAYIAQIIPSLYSAALANAKSSNAQALIQNAIASVIAAAYSGQNIPAAVVSAVLAPSVKLNVDYSSILAGYSAMTQQVSFSSAVPYSNAATQGAYDKGYGQFLGIYSTSSGYVTGTSVTGFETTSSRRGGTSISYVTVLACAAYASAYSAAAGKSTEALKAAIQAVINSEYSTLGNAATPSSIGDQEVAGFCSDNGSSGLSGGAIAGIVIGSVVGFIIIVAIVYFLACRPATAKENSNDDKNVEETAQPKHAAPKDSNEEVLADNTVQI